MLVLSRQRDETIMIGDDIEITVVDIRGDKVRLGITAPTRIAVHRKEVYEAIRQENERAARLGDRDLDSLSQSISAGPARTRRGPEVSDRTARLAAAAARSGEAPPAGGAHPSSSNGPIARTA